MVIEFGNTSGKSAYELWLADGNTGEMTDFWAAMRGSEGQPGDVGQPGIQGVPGAVGPNEWVHSLGSRYLLDPNEFNGWQADGIIDQTMTADLGNVGANVNRAAGGLCFPFDVRVKRLFAWHYNSNAAALAWGWRITSLTKTAGSNTVTHEDVLRECTGTGATAIAPRNYLSTVMQNTDVDLSSSPVVPAGNVIGFGVEAPTAITTNYYVYCLAGYMHIERV